MDIRVGRLAKVRVLPSPEDGLRTLVRHAPQAEAWADRTMARLRPTLKMLYGIRRRLATGAVAGITLWLFVHVMFGANGMVVYRQKKAEYQSLQTEIGGLQRENNRTAEQIKALQTDPATIEKTARERGLLMEKMSLPELDALWDEAKKSMATAGAESRWNRPRKRRISLRVDTEVVDWFKSKGPGYQTRINRILRRVMVEGKKRAGET